MVEKPASSLLGRAQVEAAARPLAEAATRPWAETVPDTLEPTEVEVVAALRVETAADAGGGSGGSQIRSPRGQGQSDPVTLDLG
uniref:Uncharacterized protein n=1 Tax=Oryza punctata TaxID=4537 RepID=A0A0E0LI20_ORYPU